MVMRLELIFWYLWVRRKFSFYLKITGVYLFMSILYSSLFRI